MGKITGEYFVEGIMKKALFIFVFALVLLCFPPIPAMAATTLSTGDIVFVGINSDKYDDFSFLLLKDITAGTSINITDKGWNDATGFYTAAGDGIWQWSTAADLSAGTVVHIKTTDKDGVLAPENLVATPGTVTLGEGYDFNDITVSYTGDQIFLYQGTAASPTFITGIHWNVEAGTTNSNWDGSSSLATTSALPDQLTNGVNAIWVHGDGPTEYDNFRYNSSTTSGTPSELRAAINNLANWDVDNTNTTAYTLNPFPASFTVAAEVPTVTSISPNSGLLTGGTSVTITGTNFTDASAVTIGGVAASFTVTNATTITATTPAGTVGAKDVAVTTPGGTGTGSGLFTYGAPPTVADKTITSSNISSIGVTLSWNKATDDISAQNALQYLVYRSNTNNLDTVANIETNGTAAGVFTADIATKDISGLSSATTYYFNIIVKDEAGYKTCYTTKTVTTAPNVAPTASNVQISGTAQVEQTLTGSYDYNDTESDAEGTSTFKWYRSNDNSGTGKAAIVGATAGTYTLVTDDLGKYISFEVTPAAAVGTSPGVAAESGYTDVVAAAPAYTAGASTAALTPAAGAGNMITLTVKKSDNSTDTTFDGNKTVTITGYEAAPDTTYGSFGGTGLEADGSTDVTVNFTDGVGTASLALNKAEEQTIGFSIAGVATPATNTLNITPTAGSAASLSVTQAVTAPAVNGETFAQQPKVTLKDQYGNTCIGDNTTEVTASKKDGGSWILTGTVTVMASSGVVNFTGLGATNTAEVSGAQLAFNATGLSEVTSSTVTLPAPTPAYTGTAAYDTATPAAGASNTITLTVKKSDNSTDTTFDGNKTVTITGYEAAPDTTYGSFGGTGLEADGSTDVTVNFTDGVGTASLALNKAEEQTIGFSIAGVATSATNTLTITPTAGSAASLSVTQAVTAPAVNGGTFAQQPKVTLKDQYGNTCIGDNTTEVTASKKDGGSWTLTGTVTVMASSGVVNFTGLGATNTAEVSGVQLAFNATGLSEVTSSTVTLPAPAPSGGDSGGGSSGASTPASSTTVTGEVINSKTGEKVKGLEAKVSTQSNGTTTVEVKSKEAILFKQADGTQTPVSDLSKLGFSAVSNYDAGVSMKADGTIQISNLTEAIDTAFTVTYDLGNGEKIIIGTIEVKFDSNGQVSSVTSTLIDPYGIILDSTTGEPIAGVHVTLYYADTARNKKNGKTPDILVELPILNGFEPNDNKNPQYSDESGSYAFMVFPTTDYYLAATKDGYETYKSITISVEQEIVKWDFKMNKGLTGIQRLAGESRVDTALAIAEANYTVKLKNVVLATAANYPDALAGSVLAYRLNAPILLVGSTQTEQNKIIDYLKTNLDRAGTVYILGGIGVIGQEVQNKIKAEGFTQITRVSGANRSETALKIAEQLEVPTGRPLILVNEANYADALSVSSSAAAAQYPILLTGKDGLSTQVKEKIAEIKPIKVYLIGGESVISQKAASEAAEITALDQDNIIRIGGQDRYATSLAVVEYFNLSGRNACAATGRNFPDALAGSVYAANYNAPVILVDESIPEETREYLKTRKMTGGVIFGGEGAVGKGIEQELLELLTIN